MEHDGFRLASRSIRLGSNRLLLLVGLVTGDFLERIRDDIEYRFQLGREVGREAG